MMPAYRKKPVVIEAMEYDGTNHKAVRSWMGADALDVTVSKDAVTSGGTGEIYIQTLEGLMRASIGDFIIKGVKGEFYPCRSDIFWLTYDKISGDG